MKSNKRDCKLCVHFKDDDCDIIKEVDFVGWCVNFDNKEIIKTMLS